MTLLTLLDTYAAGTSQVTSSVATSWNVNTAVSNTVATTWNVRAVATNTVATSWTVRSTVLSTVSTTWNVQAQVTSSVSTTWSLGGTVTASIPTSWNVLTSITSSNATFWSVLVPISSTLGTSWNVASRVTSSLSSTWNVSSQTTATVNTTWTTRSFVTTALGTSWNTRALVTKSGGTTWNVLALVSSSVPTLWNVNTVVLSEIQTSWSIYSAVTASVDTSWEVLFFESAALVKHWYGVGGNTVSGANLTTSTAGDSDNPFNQINGTPVQEIINGKTWIRVANVTTAHQWRYNGLNLPEWAMQFEFMPGDTAPAAMSVLTHATHVGGQLFRLQYNPNRTVSLANAAGSVISAGAISQPLTLGMNRYRFVMWSPAGQDSVWLRAYGPDKQLFWERNQALGTTNALTQMIWGRQSGGAYGPGYFTNFEIHNTAVERQAILDPGPQISIWLNGGEKAGTLFVYAGGAEKPAAAEMFFV